jgi:hypothetical protein
VKGKQLRHTCSPKRIREGKNCRACEQTTQFPYTLTHKEIERQTRYWDGMQWVTKAREVWLPPDKVITGDPELTRVLGLLLLRFGDGVSVLMKHDISPPGSTSISRSSLSKASGTGMREEP